ncbi:MAG: hypothetical protein AAF335_01850 [Bacteroidota bacterium]
MRYKETRNINDLISTALGRFSKAPSNNHNLIMQAWYQTLPKTKEQLQHTFVKGKVLYVKVKPTASVLRHQLRVSKTNTLQQLKATLRSLQSNPDIVEEIFYI